MNAGRHTDSCWRVSSTAITQTATHCHLPGRLAMSLANTSGSGVFDTTSWFVQVAKISLLIWYLLALKQRWLYVNFKCLGMFKMYQMSCKTTRAYLNKKKRNSNETTEMLINYLMEIRWHGNGEKNNGMRSHCILSAHKHWFVISFFITSLLGMSIVVQN